MAFNQRKRAADPSWASTTPPKTRRIASSSSSSAVPSTTKQPGQICKSLGSPRSSQKQQLETSFRRNNNDATVQATPTTPRTLDSQAQMSYVEHMRRSHNQLTISPLQQTVYKPQVLHRPRPESKIGQDYHWVPYPLGLMPYDSWHKLHHRTDAHPPLPFRCPICRRERTATPHLRKLFLVAERLTFEEGLTPGPEKDQNEELLWGVNYEIGILDPFVEDPGFTPGGKQSRKNRFHPYRNAYEMKQALNLIFASENITETTWSLWIDIQMDLQEILKVGDTKCQETTLEKPSTSFRNLTQRGTENSTRRRMPETKGTDWASLPKHTFEDQGGNVASGIPSPPSSYSSDIKSGLHFGAQKDTNKDEPAMSMGNEAIECTRELTEYQGSTDHRQRLSYTTLQEFYSLLDRIERTSYVGALYLEAYAERLKRDTCRDCWLKRYIELNEDSSESPS